ncbi:asparagine synthase C-terminal domain-containing protein, partial [Acinetobacter sp.]|uniref:asparagine synthetase B family protein n=1 Tax=Acinetobacter sp. TaxID=472 RepID=UPI000C5608CD
KNIKRCIPGKVYIYDIENKQLEIKNINEKQPNLNKILNKLDNQSLTNLVEEELKKSIDIHLRSDVGYSIQLSGGVDSSLITAMASQISDKSQRTFGLEIEGSPQDEKWARDLVVKRYKCDHTEVKVTSDIFAKYFSKTIKALDSPIVHSGTPALMKLYESMADYSPVAITGEGADEAFMGYSRYREAPTYQKIGLLTRILPEKMVKLTKFKEALHFTRNRSSYIFCSVYSNTTNIMDIFPSLFKGHKFNNPRSVKNNLSFIKKINSYDKKYYLQTLLHRQDLISMASSVECRTPFADKNIFNLSRSIPTNLKVGKLETKKLLKRISEKYLDKKIIYRKKIGLNIPLENWLRENDYFVSKLLTLKSNDSFLSEFANIKKLAHYVDGYLCNQYSLKDIDLFRLLCVEEWLQILIHDDFN